MLPKYCTILPGSIFVLRSIILPKIRMAVSYSTLDLSDSFAAQCWAGHCELSWHRKFQIPPKRRPYFACFTKRE